MTIPREVAKVMRKQAQWFSRWPLGHGHYSQEALEEAVEENKGMLGLFHGNTKDIAQAIAASLFVRGFGVVDEDFLKMASGKEPDYNRPGDAHRAWKEKHP